MDVIQVSPEKLPNYEQKVSFFQRKSMFIDAIFLLVFLNL